MYNQITVPTTVCCQATAAGCGALIEIWHKSQLQQNATLPPTQLGQQWNFAVYTIYAAWLLTFFKCFLIFYYFNYIVGGVTVNGSDKILKIFKKKNILKSGNAHSLGALRDR